MKLLTLSSLLLAASSSVWMMADAAPLANVKCTAENRKYLFSPCNPATQMMQSIQYYESHCNPLTSEPLGEPRSVPCFIDCKDGEFYSAKSIGCDKCDAGTSSRSNSVRIYDFKDLPEYSTTFCFPQPCSAWVPESDGAIFSSGNQSMYQKKNAWGTVDETVEASFVLLVDIVNKYGGAIKFSYRVESEKMFDGLAVFVDGQIQTNEDKDATSGSRFWATGVLYQWRTASIPIPSGKHQVKFAFTKDTNQMSNAGKEGVGYDRAYLRDISIIGVQSFASECEQCGPGTFSPFPGSPKCLPCEPNTFAVEGAFDCVPCQDTEWSPSGAGSCRQKLKCTKEDYVAMYGQCDPTTQTRHRLWKLINTRCIIDDKAIPLDGEVPCASCMAGSVFSKATQQCETCESGAALVGGTAENPTCEKCPVNTAAIPIWDYSDGFDRFGGDFPTGFSSQSCSGVCTKCSLTNHPNDDCWFELASYPMRDSDGTIVGIRQSQYMGNFYTAILSIPIELISDGVVEITYAFIHASADPTTDEAASSAVPAGLEGMIFFDGIDYVLDSSYTSTTKRVGKLSLPATTGKHTIQFVVSQSAVIDFDHRFDVVLTGIKVVGERRGGHPKCEICPSGHYCPGGTNVFLPCEPGTYAYAEGSSKCDVCADGFAQKNKGSKFCNYCPMGTVASEDKRSCINTCNISTYNGVWDLSPLRGMAFGPLIKASAGEIDESENVDAPSSSKTAVALNKLPPTAALDALAMERFYVSPCSYVNEHKNSDRTCTRNDANANGKVPDAYACQRVSGGTSYSLGDEVSYSTWNGKLVQYLSGGDFCTSARSARKRTNITYVCDPDAVPGTLTYVNENPLCQFNFVLTSKYGCYACTEESYERVETQCSAESNVKKIGYYKKPLYASCHGGYVPPAEVTFTCRMCNDNDFKIVWSDCEGGQQKPNYELLTTSLGCTDSPNFQVRRAAYLKALGPRACSKIDAKIGNNMFTLGLVFVLLGIGMACTAAYIFYKRHQDLSAKYQRLAGSAGGAMEMADQYGDFGGEDDDDDDNAEGGNNGGNAAAPAAPSSQSTSSANRTPATTQQAHQVDA